jgi:hypothetical protein
MTDAQMDQVTAGRVVSVTVVNQNLGTGNHVVLAILLTVALSTLVTWLFSKPWEVERRCVTAHHVEFLSALILQ